MRKTTIQDSRHQLPLRRRRLRRLLQTAGLAALLAAGLPASSQVLNYSINRQTDISYNSIASSGSSFSWASVTMDDAESAPVSLAGTTFLYGGQPVSSFKVSMNGYIVLNGATNAAAYSNNLSSSGPSTVLAPFWEDLYVPTGGSQAANYKYKIDGTLGSGNAVVTVEWIALETFQNPGPSLNFQLKLYEAGNRIEFIYGVMQGFSGIVGPSGAYVFSYTTGLSGATISSPPLPGQILGQQYENTTVFGHDGFGVPDQGFNRLTKMPECYSMLTFTPGTYTATAAPAVVPSNDNPAGAIDVLPYGCPPANLCKTYYSSFNASATPNVAAPCSGNPDDDVWFKFTSINSTATISVYPQGGYDAVVQAFNTDRSVSLGCVDAAGEGLTENLNLTGLTIGTTYYIRVFHKHGGTQATATATISGGAVTGFTVTNPGSGYMNAANGSTKSPIVYLTGGGGSNAVATAVTAGSNAAPGAISSLSVSSGGSGYTSAPTVTIASPNAGITGDFGINVQQLTSALANDDVCNAVVLTTNGAQQGPFTTSSATTQAGEPTPPTAASCTANNGWCNTEPAPRLNNTSWFSFVAPSSVVKIESFYVCGNSANNQLALYSAPSCAAMLTGGATLIAANDDQSASNTTAAIPFACVVPGQTYYLQMDGFSGSTGNYRLSVTPVTVSAGSYGPYCSNATAVTLTGQPAGGTFSGTGVSGNQFSPTTAGPGSHVITYALPGGCTVSTTIVVNAANALAGATSNANASVSGTTNYSANCGLISTVTPSGASPVSGAITSRVTIDPAQHYYGGQPYVRRHYDLTPATNPNTATASLVLYFTQGEFDDYNAAMPGTSNDLPTGPTDNIGKTNLRITQYHGTSGAYTPGTYSGWTGSGPANVLINPGAANVVWNSTFSRWEVSFNITGFSGFFVTSNIGSPLPLKLTAFGAAASGTRNRLNWKTAEESKGMSFEVERSATGNSFQRILGLSANGYGSDYIQFDAAPLEGLNYYRLKMLEADGSATYSQLAIVNRSSTGGTVTIAPVPAESSVMVACTDAALIGSDATIYDMQGREMHRFTLAAAHSIDISSWMPGVYSLRLPDGSVARIVKN